VEEDRFKTQGPQVKNPSDIADTIVAVATPLGESAIGVVRLSGPQAVSIVERLVGKSLFRHESSKILLYRIPHQDGILDEALISVFRAPGSYTGEEMVEISSHGSVFVMRKIVEKVVESGARVAGPGEFTLRAFLNGKMDLVQAEAVCRLIRTRTEQSHRLASRQMEGALSKTVGTLREKLLELAAHAEACLDHPEEDIPPLKPGEFLRELDGMGRCLTELKESFRFGRLLQEGVCLAIVGSPNVGKSSLLNAILRKDRAIVSEMPGTTRDTLEEWADLDGLAAWFVDTAGLRQHVLDPVEEMGMVRTRQAMEKADVILWVIDGSRPLRREDVYVHSEIRGRKALAVLNKLDAGVHPASWDGFQMERVSVSAKTGEGMAELFAKVKDLLSLPEDSPAPVYLTEVRHRQVVERTLGRLEEAGQMIRRDGTAAYDVAAVCLREGLGILGEMTGEVTSEDVLERVFSRFCVGK